MKGKAFSNTVLTPALLALIIANDLLYVARSFPRLNPQVRRRCRRALACVGVHAHYRVHNVILQLLRYSLLQGHSSHQNFCIWQSLLNIFDWKEARHRELDSRGGMLKTCRAVINLDIARQTISTSNQIWEIRCRNGHPLLLYTLQRSL